MLRDYTAREWISLACGMVLLASILPFVAPVVGVAMLLEAVDRGFSGGLVQSGQELSGLVMGRLLPWIEAKTFAYNRTWVRRDADAHIVNCALFFGLGIPGLFFALMGHAIYTGTVPYALAFLYHVFRIGPYFMSFAYVYTLCHKEGHCIAASTGLWAAPYDKRGVLRLVFNWWVGLFYGVLPTSFSVGHSVNHHRYSNNVFDVVSTADKPRDDWVNFVAYIPRWVLYASNVSVVGQFWREGDWPRVRKSIEGNLYYLSFVGLIWALAGPRFTLLYLCYPFLENVVLLACVNWCWHAFIDPDDPSNEYVGSLTLLGGPINVLNEDSHVVHHQYPGIHWSRHQRFLAKHREQYGAARNYGSVFRCTHVFEVFFMILLADYDKLADRFLGFVPPGDEIGGIGKENVDMAKLAAVKCPIPHDKAVELIKARLRACWWGPRAPDYAAIGKAPRYSATAVLLPEGEGYAENFDAELDAPEAAAEEHEALLSGRLTRSPTDSPTDPATVARRRIPLATGSAKKGN